jgi:hypothetical protein
VRASFIFSGVGMALENHNRATGRHPRDAQYCRVGSGRGRHATQTAAVRTFCQGRYRAADRSRGRRRSHREQQRQARDEQSDAPCPVAGCVGIGPLCRRQARRGDAGDAVPRPMPKTALRSIPSRGACETRARTIRLDAARSRDELGSARGIRDNSGQGAEPARRLGRCR